MERRRPALQTSRLVPPDQPFRRRPVRGREPVGRGREEGCVAHAKRLEDSQPKDVLERLRARASSTPRTDAPWREPMARMGHSSMRAALIYQHATAGS
jgi:hypothetical protein